MPATDADDAAGNRTPSRSNPQEPLPEQPSRDPFQSILARQRSAVLDRARQLRHVAQVAPGPFAAVLALVTLELAAGAASLISIGQIVGGVVDQDSSRIVLGAGLMIGALVVTPVSTVGTEALTVRIESRLREHRAVRLAAALLAPEGIGHLDDDATAREAEQMIAASRHFFLLLAGMATVGWLRARITGFAPFVLIAAWHWWAAVMLAVAAQIAAITAIGYLRRVLSLVTDQDPSLDRRRETAAFELAAGAGAAREVRLFGLLPWIAPRLAQHRPGDPLRTQDLKEGRGAHAGSVIVLVAMLSAIALLVVEGMQGRIPISQVAVLAPACLALLMNWGPLGDIHIIVLEAGAFERRLDRFGARLGKEATASSRPQEQDRQDHQGQRVHEQEQALNAFPHPHHLHLGQGAGSIEIRDLAFRYPGRSTDTLHGLTLSIPAGQSVGIVGANGAGKSTLMSLLAGFEEPTEGTVRIGGRTPRAADDGAPQVAVILQDFTRYPLDVRDNVLLGRGTGPGRRPLDGTDADNAVREVVGRAGGTSVLERLDRADHGLDTILAPGYGMGTDLSGGQWQRLALARALAAVDAGAELLILDEPTSALDVRVESELFADLLKLTSGVTTLLVSHRLSSVRRADRIVVLDEGRVIEDGTHDELLAGGGRYATMFTLQARRFTDAAGRNDDA